MLPTTVIRQQTRASRDRGPFLRQLSMRPPGCCSFRGGFGKRRHQVAAEHRGSRHKTTQQCSRDTKADNILPGQIKIADRSSRGQAAQPKAFGRPTQSIRFAALVVHEMTRAERGRQFCIIDLSGERRDMMLELPLEPNGEFLFERLVILSAALPSGVLPAFEPIVRHQRNHFDGGTARMTSLKIRVFG